MSTYSPSYSYSTLKFNAFDEQNENQRPYIPQKNISLRRLSIVSFITNLWTDGTLEEHLQNVLMSNRTLIEEQNWLLKEAKEIVERLELPLLLKHEMLILLERISFDFLKYLDRLMSNEFFPYEGNIKDIIKNITWDMHGGIDEVQTFRNMKYANYHYNYIVSTLYCLEDDIPQMWARLSPVYRPIFSLKKIYSGGFDSYATFIIYYWTCRVKSREFLIHSLEDPIGLFNHIRNCTTDLKMFVVSLHSYNIHSFQYFWRRLDSNEQNIAVDILCSIYEMDDLYRLSNFYETVKNSTEIILFVLSQINDNQCSKVIRRCLPQMLVNFWQFWQVHHVILPLFENYIEFLDGTAYKHIFNTLHDQISEHSPKEKLLHQMYLASPPHLQSLISEEEKRTIFFGNGTGKINRDNS